MLAPIVHAGLDESGALTAATPLFVMAAVLTPHPEAIQYLIRRVALRSGKRLHRRRKAASELKWRNASQYIRRGVLGSLAQTDVAVFTLTVRKRGRQIEDRTRSSIATGRHGVYFPSHMWIVSAVLWCSWRILWPVASMIGTRQATRHLV